MSKTELLIEQMKTASDPAMTERVTVTLPRIRGGETDVTVGLNGKFYKIQRGVPVSIPRAVYEILEHSWDADTKADEYIASLNK